MTFVKLLPLAFVMIAGPQILSAIFLATTENWRKTSAAFLGGAAISVTLIATVGFLLSNGAADDPSSKTRLDVTILVLLLGAALHKYLTRAQSRPPKWMGKLQTITPSGSFKLGFLLLGVFPTDILTALAVGGSVSSAGEPWWHVTGFVALTLLLVGLPALMMVVFGSRAEAAMPKVRDWMNDNSWVVGEIVLGLFVALTLSSLLS